MLDFLPSHVRYVVCADWSAAQKGRAAFVADIHARAVARLVPRAGRLTLTSLLAEARSLARTGPVLVGLDLPIGLPAGYFAAARREPDWASAPGFVEWLPLACSTPAFFSPTDGGRWSVVRPFFSVPAGQGTLRRITARIADSGAAPRRRIDELTRAKSMFITSGIPGSVGSSACNVWGELGRLLGAPRDFALWPMEGDLGRLFVNCDLVLGEVYPRAAYATALTDGASIDRRALNVAKTRPLVRDAAVTDLLQQRWVRANSIAFADADDARVNEDCFDAMLSAAAILRCSVEGTAIADLSHGDPAIEGAMLCTGSANLTLRSRTYRVPSDAGRVA